MLPTILDQLVEIQMILVNHTALIVIQVPPHRSLFLEVLLLHGILFQHHLLEVYIGIKESLIDMVALVMVGKTGMVMVGKHIGVVHKFHKTDLNQLHHGLLQLILLQQNPHHLITDLHHLIPDLLDKVTLVRKKYYELPRNTL
jgi:hypothetical protein